MASYGSFSRAPYAVYAEQWGHPLVLWLLCQQPTFTTAYLLYYGSDGSRCVRSQSPLYCITCDAIKHEKQPNKVLKPSLQVPLLWDGRPTHSIGWIHRLCSCHDSSHGCTSRNSPERDRTAIPQFLLLQFYPLIITDYHHHVINLWCSKWYDR